MRLTCFYAFAALTFGGVSHISLSAVCAIRSSCAFAVLRLLFVVYELRIHYSCFSIYACIYNMLVYNIYIYIYIYMFNGVVRYYYLLGACLLFFRSRLLSGCCTFVALCRVGRAL